MGWWFSKKSPEFREHQLPGEVGSVRLPSTLEVEFEEEGKTLIAWHKGHNSIALRLSSISIVQQDDAEHVAKSHVRTTAAERGYEFMEIGENGVASFETSSEHEGIPLLIKFWQVGGKSTIVFISASIIAN